MNNKFNKIVEYDTKAFPFRELISDVVSNYLGVKVHDISTIHKYIDFKNVQNLNYEIYNFFKSQKFQVFYREFCQSILDIYFDEGSKYQAIPSIRIHYPGKKTVNFHNDMMYGHGEDIVNIWIPLTKIHNTNSLYVLSEDDSIKIANSLKENKWSIKELNSNSALLSNPLKIKYGQYFIFRTWVIHGSTESTFNSTRISFDIRFCPQGGEIGLKDKSFFVNKKISKLNETNLNPKMKTAAIYMHNYLGFTNNISTRYQSSLCQFYCENNNFKVIAEETELRTVDHQPSLHDLCFGIYKGKIDSLVMISIQLLPKNKEKRIRFLQDLKNEKFEIHFVLEDYCFNKKSSIDEFMNVYSESIAINERYKLE